MLWEILVSIPLLVKLCAAKVGVLWLGISLPPAPENSTPRHLTHQMGHVPPTGKYLGNMVLSCCLCWLLSSLFGRTAAFRATLSTVNL